MNATYSALEVTTMYTSLDTGVAARLRPESRRSRLELAIAPSAVRIARRWTADQLARTDPPPDRDLIDSAVLLVSELVTNAIRAVGKAAVGKATAASRVTTTLSGLLPAGTRQTGIPQTSTPQTSTPQTSTPQTSTPQTSTPQTSVTVSRAAVPGAAVPGWAAPGWAVPGAAMPGVGRVLPLGDLPPGVGPPGSAAPTGRPIVCLVIIRLDRIVRIEVHDSSYTPLTAMCHRDADDETGRGLTVVAALAASWGWRPDACGKVVWCELVSAS